MGVTAKCLVEAQFVPAANTTVYTAPLGTRTIIDKFTVTNVDGSNAHTIAVYITPSGASTGFSNQLINPTSIAAVTTLDSTVMQNQILNPSDFIVCLASVGSNLVVRCSGREVT